MTYFEIKNNFNRILSSNLNDCSYLEKVPNEGKLIIGGNRVRSGLKRIGDISIRLISEDDDLFLSKKLFNKTINVLGAMSGVFFDYYTNKIKNHSHTLKNIQGQMKQKMESLISEKVTTHSYGYDEFKDKVKEEITSDLDLTAEVVCYLNKRIFDINAHIECFDILSLDGKGDYNFIEHNIKKLLLRIFQPFFEDLKQKEVDVKFLIKDEYAKKNKVVLDYKTFNLAMYNFFDNAVKYTKPNSEISITFEKNSKNFQIKIGMMSLRIEREEIEKIFEEGYSGENAKNEAGDGIGMFTAKEALRLNNLDIKVAPNYSKSVVLNGNKYIDNTFLITSEK